MRESVGSRRCPFLIVKCFKITAAMTGMGDDGQFLKAPVTGVDEPSVRSFADVERIRMVGCHISWQ